MPEDTIWVHAVSVGEVQAAAVLVRTLHDRYPGIPLVVTTLTPTGRSVLARCSAIARTFAICRSICPAR